MQVSGSTQAQVFSSVSVLQAASKEPRLAGELISKTVASLSQTQSVQSSAQHAVLSGTPGIGEIINRTA